MPFLFEPAQELVLLLLKSSTPSSFIIWRYPGTPRSYLRGGLAIAARIISVNRLAEEHPC
jgi:hypothetical protein